MKCASCGNDIILPADWPNPDEVGKLDPLALDGDLCDECSELERDIAEMQAEWRAMERLEERLRRRQ